ncbi:MAG: hypothetical protein MR300_02230 [Ruminococcus sp.]|nr:hypothetical protein [Ruminococcus sp.]
MNNINSINTKTAYRQQLCKRFLLQIAMLFIFETLGHENIETTLQTYSHLYQNCYRTKLILTKGQKSLSQLHSFNYNKIRILLTKSLVFSRVSAILGVKNDLKGIAPSRSFENIKFYRWLKIGVAQKQVLPKNI